MALAHYSPSPHHAPPAPGIDDAAWIDAFSIEKYRPLLRLVAEVDEDYVSASLGRDVAKAYSKLRKTIVKDYLRSLSADFNRIHQIATAKAVHASDDDGALSFALIEQKMSFIFNIWTLELRLTLRGVVPNQVSLEPVLRYMEDLAAQTRELTSPKLSYHVT